MIKRIFRNTSIRTLIVSNFIILTAAVVSWCMFLVYFGQQNTQSIQSQKIIDVDYDSAINLKAAIDEILYFSMEMSNSLSDKSLNNFERSLKLADKLIDSIDNESFKSQLQEQKLKIEENALLALDAYIVDDRMSGDTHMIIIREAAASLKSDLTANVTNYKNLRDFETDSIRQRTEFIENTTIAMAIITIVGLLICTLLIWKTIFKPVQSIIQSISHAARNTNRAIDYKILDLPNNEIGDTGTALNHLFEAITTAIDEAQSRAKDAEIAQTRWRALFDRSPDAIVILDPKTTKILDHNESTKNLLCLSDKDLHASSELNGLEFHDHEIQEFKSYINEICVNGFARSDDLNCNVENHTIPVSVVGVTVPHENDTALLLHIRDISEQRRHEEELNAARLQAENANEAKSNFLANMSHEIRTPMNGIMGMAQILSRSEISEEQSKFVDIIESSCTSLLAVINDILEISKIDADQIEFDNKPLNMNIIAENVLGLMAVAADDKNIELILHYQPNFPADFIGDEDRIRQILVNLVGNALKFTEKGHVIVEVGGTIEDNNALISVRVIDTGIGIPENSLGGIFEKFNQVDNSSTRKYEGTGLGLSICRLLVEKMDGTIGVESIPGDGSTFWFEISLPLNIEEASSPETSEMFKGKKCLIIDDNAHYREYLTKQLIAWGFHVEAHSNCSQSQKFLYNADAQATPFDVIVAEYNLIEGNGVDCIRDISKHPLTETAATIILAPVSKGLEDIDRAKTIIDAILKKPVFKAELLETFLTLLNEKSLNALTSISKIAAPINQCTNNSSTNTLSSHRILLVEDNKISQLVMSAILNNLGYQYDIANDGKQGVETFSSCHHDIILMDISMPEMNGYEATAEIRKLCTENGKQPIIIALTANALQEDRDKCQQAGMDGFISKPVNIDTLDAELSRFVKMKHVSN